MQSSGEQNELKQRAPKDGVLAIILPLAFTGLLVLLSPTNPANDLFFQHLTGEFWFCVAGVFWFGWRLGGETAEKQDLAGQFWTSSLVIFIIVLMLYYYTEWSIGQGISQAVLTKLSPGENTLARYPSYYLFYVLLTYAIIYVGHLKVGAYRERKV